MNKASKEKNSIQSMSLLEDHYKFLVDNTSDILFLSDAHGKLIYVTPSGEKILGFKNTDFIGKSVVDFIHSGDRKSFRSFGKTVLVEKKEFYSKARIKNKSGDHVWLETVTKPIYDEDGNFKYTLSTARDITKQVVAEEDHKGIQVLIEDALSEIYLVDPETVLFTYGNQAALENLGYTPEEFKKLGPHDLTPNGNKAFFKKRFKDILSSEKKKTVHEGINRRKDGTFYDVEVVLQAVERDGKKLIAALLNDITEKKTVRAEAEAINRRHRLFTEITNDIIMQRDPDGIIHYVSPAVKRHLGYAPEELISKPFWDFLDDHSKTLIPEWREKIYDKGESLRLQVKVKTKKGKFIWIESETQPIKNERGRTIYSVSSMRNIDAEKKAEEEAAKLASIVENAENEIYVIQPGTLKFLYVNTQARKNLGYSREELMKMTPADIAGSLNRAEIVNFFQLTEKEEGRVIRIEGKNKRKDGSLYNTSLVCQYMDIGEEGIFVAFVEDITEKIEKREQLFQAQKMEVVGQLTGGTAHNFNNLLMAILGSLRLIEKNEQDPMKQELLNIAISSTKKGADLTHRLLAFSRKQKLEPTRINIREAMPGIETLISFAMGGAAEIVINEIENDLFIKVDQSEFENSVLNLAINARDAMGSAGRMVISAYETRMDTAKAAKLECEPGDYVITEVADNGKGMTEDVLERALEPFFTTKDVDQGSGLGLSMVFGFVKQSRGTMEIESEPEKGTKVKLYLPKD